MNHDTLARQFDDAAVALTAAGHAIIVRKARALLSDGDVDGAMAFVQEASERTPLMAINSLNSALVAWKSAGNKATDLRRNPSWKAGSVRDDRVADTLAQLPTGDVQGLVGTLLTETQTAGTAPADDAGTLTGPQAIGSIFGQRDTGSQPVEETSNLVAKPLSLDEAPPAAPEAPAKQSKPKQTRQSKPKSKPVKAPPPPAETPKTPPPPAVEAVAETVKEAAKPAPPPPPTELDTAAPTSVDRPDESSASLWVGLVIVVAAIVFLIWYTNQSG
jgi:hypothetical protein